MSLSDLFSGLFDTTTTQSTSPALFFLCLVVAIVIGLLLALMHMRSGNSSSSFVVTLALLPPIVATVIIMVNGSIGAGVAVAGAFSLVRFRSIPGTAREIGSIFLAMGSGLVVGMGYPVYAVLFALILSCVIMAYNKLGLGKARDEDRMKRLRITVPENLDYDHELDHVISSYTSSHELASTKTSDMGSVFRLEYDVVLKEGASEKAFLDDIRCRNGNLEVMLGRKETRGYEL